MKGFFTHTDSTLLQTQRCPSCPLCVQQAPGLLYPLKIPRAPFDERRREKASAVEAQIMFHSSRTICTAIQLYTNVHSYSYYTVTTVRLHIHLSPSFPIFPWVMLAPMRTGSPCSYDSLAAWLLKRSGFYLSPACCIQSEASGQNDKC